MFYKCKTETPETKQSDQITGIFLFDLLSSLPPKIQLLNDRGEKAASVLCEKGGGDILKITLDLIPPGLLGLRDNP